MVGPQVVSARPPRREPARAPPRARGDALDGSGRARRLADPGLRPRSLRDHLLRVRPRGAGPRPSGVADSCPGPYLGADPDHPSRSIHPPTASGACADRGAAIGLITRASSRTGLRLGSNSNERGPRQHFASESVNRSDLRLKLAGRRAGIRTSSDESNRAPARAAAHGKAPGRERVRPASSGWR